MKQWIFGFVLALALLPAFPHAVYAQDCGDTVATSDSSTTGSAEDDMTSAAGTTSTTDPTRSEDESDIVPTPPDLSTDGTSVDLPGGAGSISVDGDTVQIDTPNGDTSVSINGNTATITGPEGDASVTLNGDTATVTTQDGTETVNIGNGTVTSGSQHADDEGTQTTVNADADSSAPSSQQHSATQPSSDSSGSTPVPMPTPPSSDSSGSTPAPMPNAPAASPAAQAPTGTSSADSAAASGTENAAEPALNAQPSPQPQPAGSPVAQNHAPDSDSTAKAAPAQADDDEEDDTSAPTSVSFGPITQHAGSDALTNAVKKAATDYPDKCNFSTAEAADAMGNTDLDRMDANKQVAYMEEHWEKVSTAEEAQALANQGVLVVAGLPDLQPNHHGHTAIVVPGQLTQIGAHQYPVVMGGASDPIEYTNGEKDADGDDIYYTVDPLQPTSAGKVFRRTKRDNVGYYTPNTDDDE